MKALGVMEGAHYICYVVTHTHGTTGIRKPPLPPRIVFQLEYGGCADALRAKSAAAGLGDGKLFVRALSGEGLWGSAFHRRGAGLPLRRGEYVAIFTRMEAQAAGHSERVAIAAPDPAASACRYGGGPAPPEPCCVLAGTC